MSEVNVIVIEGGHDDEHGYCAKLVQYSDYAALESRNAELEAEVTQLRASLGEKIVSETTLKHISVTNGFHVALEGGACRLFAEAFASDFLGSGAENYVEARFESKVMLPGEAFIVTLQRVAGKTPHQLRRDAEDRAAEVFAQHTTTLRRIDELETRLAQADGVLVAAQKDIARLDFLECEAGIVRRDQKRPPGHLGVPQYIEWGWIAAHDRPKAASLREAADIAMAQEGRQG